VLLDTADAVEYIAEYLVVAAAGATEYLVLTAAGTAGELVVKAGAVEWAVAVTGTTE